MEYYKCYLLGHHFRVRSDHEALKWLFSMKEPKYQIARWIEVLSEFDFELEYCPGKSMEMLMHCQDVLILETALAWWLKSMFSHASHAKSA